TIASAARLKIASATMISSKVKPFCVGCELPDNAHVPGRGQRKCYGRRIMLERDIGRA
ncbi:MAG: hypothetical protein RIS65_445, partial [Pseudomonadota bacterium]